MNFVWSLILFASLVFAVAGPIFFGHALVARGQWFATSAVCLLIAAVLFFIQARFHRDTGGRGY